jgi:hypothetical protein
LSFEIAASLRRLKPQKHTAPLQRRPDADLVFVDAVDAAGGPLLLDTTVYIDALQDRLPASMAELLRVRQLNHSSVAVGELAHLLGRLDPAHPATAGVCATIESTIANIPAHRLLAPAVAVTAEAGILTGLYARLQGLAKQDRQPLFNDAQLFLQAHAQGCYLLTRNIGDMDCLQQLLPVGRVLFYRQKA